MDYDKLIGRLIGVADGVIEETASERRRLARETLVHISTLQAENAEMEEQLNEFSKFLCHMTGNLLSKTNYTAQAMISATEDYQQRVCDNDCALRADLARVTAERDAAVEAVKNMAEYIVCAGRVDYYLCDEISQEHHLKYQPKNDGNYDNEPCYKCIADWFLQGHKW